MSELKPCPFCGSEAYEDEIRDPDGGYSEVCCNECHGGEGVPFVGVHANSMEEAREIWNRRAVPDLSVAPNADIHDRLNRLIVGGCTCDTKSPELQYHGERCHYRLASEIQELIVLRTKAEVWRPIDSAPKDHDILLSAGAHGAIRGYWWDGNDDFPSGGFVGRYMMPGLTLDERNGTRATHWMPLPPGPEKGDSNG